MVTSHHTALTTAAALDTLHSFLLHFLLLLLLFASLLFSSSHYSIFIPSVLTPLLFSSVLFNASSLSSPSFIPLPRTLAVGSEGGISVFSLLNPVCLLLHPNPAFQELLSALHLHLYFIITHFSFERHTFAAFVCSVPPSAPPSPALPAPPPLLFYQ